MSPSGKCGVDPRTNLMGGKGADLATDLVARPIQHHGGDPLDAELGRHRRFVIHVNFDDAQRTRSLKGELLKCWGNGPARPTPRRPQINENRNCRVTDDRGELSPLGVDKPGKIG